MCFWIIILTCISSNFDDILLNFFELLFGLEWPTPNMKNWPFVELPQIPKLHLDLDLSLRKFHLQIHGCDVFKVSSSYPSLVDFGIHFFLGFPSKCSWIRFPNSRYVSNVCILKKFCIKIDSFCFRPGVFGICWTLLPLCNILFKSVGSVLNVCPRNVAIVLEWFSIHHMFQVSMVANVGLRWFPLAICTLGFGSSPRKKLLKFTSIRAMRKSLKSLKFEASLLSVCFTKRKIWKRRQAQIKNIQHSSEAF